MLKYRNLNQPPMLALVTRPATTKAYLMNNILRFAFVAIFLAASSQALACDYPARPHVPDGTSASKDELLAAKAGVTEFLSGVDEYLRCVETEEQAAIDAMDDPDPEVVQEHEEALNRKFDAANEEKALVGEQFNQQVRAYNEKREQSQ